MKAAMHAVAASIGLRELTAAVGAASLWWGLHSIYRPAAPLTFGLLLLWAAFGRRLVTPR